MNTFLFLFSFLFSHDLWAFKINLTESILNVGNGQYSVTAKVINDGDGLIAIEATPRIRSYSKDGVESFDKDAENLVIVPSQMIIPANSEQILNIRWIGPREIPIEKAYRLVIEYVSVSEDKLKGISKEDKKAGVNINYKIAKSFYVVPQNAQADVVLQNYQKETVGTAELLKLSFANIGTGHIIAHGFDIKITTTSDEEKTVSFNKTQMGGSVNFLAQEVRDVVVPWPKLLQGLEIKKAEIVRLSE